jgi:hypothetical protein
VDLQIAKQYNIAFGNIYSFQHITHAALRIVYFSAGALRTSGENVKLSHI